MSDTEDRHSKTEEATEKRIDDALAKGRVSYTREIPLFLSSCATWVAVAYLMSDAMGQLCVALAPLWNQSTELRIATSGDAAQLLAYVGGNALLPFLPIVGLLAAAGLVGSLAQSRGMYAERVRPQLSRISPASGWRRIFGGDGMAHNLKSTLGLAVVAIAASTAISQMMRQSLSLNDADPASLLVALPAMSSQLLMAMLAGMVVVTSVDTFLTRLNWRRGLRMSKQEIVDESKEVDGNPQIKLRMRMLARRRLRKRMIAAVPSATVIVTNPTHYAIALRYVPGETPAPIVVAKGRDHLALKIRQVAVDNGKPIVEDRPLARALYDGVEVDATIPPELYKAVARVILFINKAARP